jgi:hypothetical protein
VLGLGAVSWFDMGIWLMLRDVSWLVLELCEGFGDVFKYMDRPSCVIPVDVHAKVPLTVPIMGALVVLAESGGDMFGVVTTNVLDAQIIYP